MLSYRYAFLLNTLFRHWTRNPNLEHLYFFVEAVRHSQFSPRKAAVLFKKALGLAIEKEHWKDSGLIAEHYAQELKQRQEDVQARDYLEQASFYYGKVGATIKEQ